MEPAMTRRPRPLRTCRAARPRAGTTTRTDRDDGGAGEVWKSGRREPGQGPKSSVDLRGDRRDDVDESRQSDQPRQYLPRAPGPGSAEAEDGPGRSRDRRREVDGPGSGG